jgi:hypothetical protein
MDALGDAADIATIATGLAAVTAAVAWVRNQWDGWQAQRRARHLRNWAGYIDVGGVDAWYVRLAEAEDETSATVTLEVTDREGRPDTGMARNLRIHARADGQLGRVPTPAELEFLRHLRVNEGYDKRNMLIR